MGLSICPITSSINPKYFLFGKKMILSKFKTLRTLLLIPVIKISLSIIFLTIPHSSNLSSNVTSKGIG